MILKTSSIFITMEWMQSTQAMKFQNLMIPFSHQSTEKSWINLT